MDFGVLNNLEVVVVLSYILLESWRSKFQGWWIPKDFNIFCEIYIKKKKKNQLDFCGLWIEPTSSLADCELSLCHSFWRWGVGFIRWVTDHTCQDCKVRSIKGGERLRVTFFLLTLFLSLACDPIKGKNNLSSMSSSPIINKWSDTSHAPHLLFPGI